MNFKTLLQTKRIRNLVLTVLLAFGMIFSCLFLFACGEPGTHSVLLLDEDRKTIIYADTVETGSSITQIVPPTKNADAEYTYTFSGWVDEDGNDVLLAFINKDITAYATYEANKREYSLNIMANGNSIASYDQVEVIRDDTYLTTGSVLYYGDQLEVNIKGSEGHEITNTNYSGLEKVEGTNSYYKVIGDVSISYYEEPYKYSVRLLNYDGTQLYLTNVEHGDGVTIDVIPTRETDLRASYIFDGWVDSNGDLLDLTKITTNITGYAHFKENLINYTLSINNPSKISVFKDDVELYDGSKIHYNDILTIQTNVTEGYHIKSIIANGDIDISSGTFKVTGNMNIVYTEEINTYVVALFDENKTTSLFSKNDVTHGSIVSVANPSKTADKTYTYEFVGWFDASGNEVDLNNVTNNITAYAKYEPTYIEYDLNMTKRIKVITQDGTVYTSESIAPTLHYNDIITIEYELADGFEVNKFNVTGASLNEDKYIVNDDVNIEFAMEKTFSALKYKNLQLFNHFNSTNGENITSEQCTDNETNFTYTYIGLEEINYTPIYEDFLAMKPITIYEGQPSYTPNFDNNVFTAGGMSNVGVITTPLYKGMTIEFTINETSLQQFLFGISTQEWLDNAIEHTGSQNSAYYYSGEYNYWSYSANTTLSYLGVNTSNTPRLTTINSEYNIFGSVNYTIRLVLNDTLELYIDGKLIDIDTSSQYVPDYNIEDGTAYYFNTFMNGKTCKLTITDFGYYENTKEAYLTYLNDKIITVFGDSITAGSGASSTSYKYSSLLSSELGMTLENKGIGNTGYCTGRNLNTSDETFTDASRINDVDSISTDTEILIVFLGINDIRNSSDIWGNLGEINSTDTTTIYGAINVMYSSIVEKLINSNTSVFICSPTPTTSDLDGSYVYGGGYTLQEFSDILEERAQHYGFQFIDLLNLCNFTADTFNDSVHPNDSGHAKIAECIYDAIIDYGRYTYI